MNIKEFFADAENQKLYVFDLKRKEFFDDYKFDALTSDYLSLKREPDSTWTFYLEQASEFAILYEYKEDEWFLQIGGQANSYYNVIIFKSLDLAKKIVKLYIESELDKQKSLLDAVNGKKSRLASLLEDDGESKSQISPSKESLISESQGDCTSKSVVELWKDMRFEVFAQATGNKCQPADSDDTTPMFSLNDIDEIVEMLSNPKPEAKFEIKPDSWYVCKREVCLGLKDKVKVISFKEGVPYSGTDILKCNLSFGPEFYLKYFRLWTICDAKPGDILACGELIALFQEIDRVNIGPKIKCYCSYDGLSSSRFKFFVPSIHSASLFHPATKEQCDTFFQKIKEAGYEWNPDKKELKRIDDKTKFKVGDWIVQDNAGIYKVTEICESWYEVVDSAELHYSIDFDQESMCHLWSIQEAKPGDVLAIGWKDKHGHDWQKIVIFKSLTEFSVEGYGNTFKNNELAFEDESVPHLSNTWTKNLHPATKEQRDLLFQKMKESGYEWDSDKKEIHKILEVKTCAKKRGENEAVTKIEPKFKINDVMRTLEEANDDITEGLPVVISIDDDYYHCNNETIAIKDQDEYEYPPMNAKQKEIKTRRMTNQELSWWLRDCPEEHREICRVDEDTIYSRYIYRECDANEEAPEFVRIRKNGGEWMEPLIED